MSDRFEDLRRLRPERVCIIKPSALGDIVNALPVLSALRRHWPDARIAWVVNQGLRGLVDGHPEIDEVIPFDRASVRLGPAGLVALGRFLAGMRRRRFDLTIDLQGLLRSGLMTAAAGAPIRVGLASAREGAGWFYTHVIPTPVPEPHAVDRLLEVARAFGADVSAPRCVVAMTPEDRLWARAALAGVPSPRLVLNAGAAWPTKRWPPEHFAAVGLKAVARLGAGLIAIGSPDDRTTIELVKARLGEVPLLDLGGRTTLPQLAAVAAESDLVLSNDSGPLHLAAAVGVRVVGIYTCTSPALNGPYGPRALAVGTHVCCAASYLTTCKRLDCMRELTPDRVWDAVLRHWQARDELSPTAA